jgi:MFS family permease
VRFSLVTVGIDYRAHVTGRHGRHYGASGAGLRAGYFPEAEKPLALSIYGAVFGLASVIGQVLGGLLISADLFHLGWRTIFLVNLPVALLVILFGLPLLKETRAQSVQRLDPVGMLLATVTLSALIIPLTEGREAGWPWWTWLLFLAVPLLASLLWRYERHLKQNGGSPLLDPAVLGAPGWARDWRSFCCFIPSAPSFFCFLFICKAPCI